MSLDAQIGELARERSQRLFAPEDVCSQRQPGTLVASMGEAEPPDAPWSLRAQVILDSHSTPGPAHVGLGALAGASADVKANAAGSSGHEGREEARHCSQLKVLPLTKPHARKLIKLCRQAPYGKGTETVVDTDVRRVWELDPAQFQLTNPKWDEFIASIVDDVKETLGLGRQKLVAHLYRLSG